MRWWIVLLAACSLDRAIPFDDPIVPPAGVDLARNPTPAVPDLTWAPQLDLTQPATADFSAPTSDLTARPDLAVPPVLPDLSRFDIAEVPRTPDLPMGQMFGAAYLVLAGDVDGDGAADLVEIGSEGSLGWTLTWWKGDGSGSFAVQPAKILLGDGFIRGGRLIDIDGDGKLDVVAADEGASRMIISRNSGGSFAAIESVSLANSSGVEDVEAADLDGDGVLDFAAVGQDGYVRVLRGRGASPPSEVHMYAVGREPVAIRSADFNGDGKLDLVTANRYGSSVSRLLGNGNLSFSAATNLAAGNYPSSLAVGDFDRDGAVDIAVQNEKPYPPNGAGQVTVLYGTSSGGVRSTASLSLTSAGSFWNWLAAADLDGDGHPDLVGGNTDTGGTTILPSSGGSTVVLSPNLGSWSGAFADFNGDGKLDVALATFNNGAVGTQIYLSR